MAETDIELAQVAETVVSQTGIQDGYSLVLDYCSGRLAFELAKRTNLSICAVFTDQASANQARRAYARADMHLTRIVAIKHQGDGALPFPSYFADLIVSEAAALGGPLPGNAAEIARVQKPIRGVTLIGGKQDAAGLKKWAATTGQKKWQAIYWGHRAFDRDKVPVLVIDSLPK